MEFGVDVADVSANGVETDMAMAGDHLIAIAFYEIAQDFLFAVEEMIFKAVGVGMLEGLQATKFRSPGIHLLQVTNMNYIAKKII
jgi:hypothetical protein